jgi:hypothetical protein
MIEHLFLVIEFELVFEFCLSSFFKKKIENPSFLFPVPCAALLSKSGHAPSAPSSGRRCPLALRSPLRLWPSAAQLQPPPQLPLTGGSRPSSPTLGRCPTRAGTPTPSQLCARPWPQARTPRSPRLYKARRLARTVPFCLKP